VWLLLTGLFALVLLAGFLVREKRAARRGESALAAMAEQARARAATMDATVMGMPDGILVVDSNLRIVQWNARFSEFTGVPHEMLRVGLDLSEILLAQATAGEFGPVGIQAEVARRMALIRSGASVGTIERARPDGRTLELRRSPMAGGGFVTLYTDISIRRQAENQLRQAQKMEAVGHLTGGVAHDFNNLLVVILGSLELAERSLDAADFPRARRRVETARKGAERAVILTQRLLAFARRQNLDPQAVDANKVVAGISEIIRHSIGSGVELETVLAGGLWNAVVDPNQLENALLNLAINARDAMPDGGKITIATANAHLDAADAAANAEVTPGQYVLVAVSDGGTGMTPDEAARAFEPFFTTKDFGKGSGLGLSQVFGFIKQSNGHVKIYSEPGAGTTVKLYLPRFVAEHPPLSETEAPPPDPPRAHECVLVVEDDEHVLAYATEALETLGYHVIGAKDAPSALLALESHPEIALLFTDVELPGLNGPDLAKEALARWPGLGVLYTTGYSTNAVVHRGILDREVMSINEPFTLAELATTMREALDAGIIDRALLRESQ